MVSGWRRSVHGPASPGLLSSQQTLSSARSQPTAGTTTEKPKPGASCTARGEQGARRLGAGAQILRGAPVRARLAVTALLRYQLPAHRVLRLHRSSSLPRQTARRPGTVHRRATAVRTARSPPIDHSLRSCSSCKPSTVRQAATALPPASSQDPQ